MKIQGAIKFSIDGRVTYRYYKNALSRTHIIESMLPLRLEGKECHYTIMPDSPLPITRKHPNLKVFVPFNIQYKIIDEYVPNSHSNGQESLARRYNISRHDVSAIIQFNKL